jgi:RNA-directed DNA polymerase
MSASSSFRHKSSKRHLRHIFRTYVFDSTSVGRDGQQASAIEGEWDSTASLLQKKLRDGSYQYTNYRENLLSKGSRSRPRVVSIATARDRIVLKALASVITDVFPATRTPLAQTRIVELVRILADTKFDTFIRIDVKDFYPSIPHAVVMERLGQKIRQRNILLLIRRAISTPTVPMKAPRPHYSSLYGVPQGLPLSNALAELTMAEVDTAYQTDPRAAYFRYVDDILLLCTSVEATTLFNEVRASLARIGLTVHDIAEGSKSQVGSLQGTFDFLGYEFGPSGVTVRKSSTRKLESTIVGLFTAYKHELANAGDNARRLRAVEALAARVNLVITGCVYEGAARGWLHYFSQMDDFTLLSRLDAYVKRLRARYRIPDSVKLKSFSRAYWHIRKPKRHTPAYIPNFDRFAGVDQRQLLLTLVPDLKAEQLDRFTPEELTKRFNAEVRRIVKMLERDTSQLS